MPVLQTSIMQSFPGLELQGQFRPLVAEFISTKNVYTFSSLMHHITPKSLRRTHSATQGPKPQGFRVSAGPFKSPEGNVGFGSWATSAPKRSGLGF